jgi:hypothetical protein
VATGLSTPEARIKKLAELGDPLDNMAWAVRSSKYYGDPGLHSKAAQDAVLARLKEAVDGGGTYNQIQRRLKKALGAMKDELEVGGKFW